MSERPSSVKKSISHYPGTVNTKSAFFRTSATFPYHSKRYFSYLRRAPYQDNRCTSLGDGGAGGRAPADATPATPKRLLLNKTIPNSQILKQDTVQDMQLTSEVSANRYALAPAECAPACSAEGIATSEKEKSHSCELAWLFSTTRKS